MATKVIEINRAPVLTLWAAIVAERLGYDWAAALTLGKAVAGLNAQAKGRRLGIYSKPETAAAEGRRMKSNLGEEFWVEVCGRGVPAKNTQAGIRAVVGAEPIDPASVQRYLEAKFEADLESVQAAMRALAASYPPDELEDVAFGLYEGFRPEVSQGKSGWGRKGKLELEAIRRLERKDRRPA